MNILIINGTIDCAGGKILLYKGINKYTEHTCRHLVAEENYMQFETDIVLSKYDNDFFFEIDRLARKSDVLWFHMWDYNKPFGLINWRHYLEGKRVLFNGQSSHEPGKTRHHLYKEGKVYNYYKDTPTQTVSFHANELVYKGAKWVPIYKPVHNEEYLPNRKKTFNGALIIGQSPSTPFSKNTDMLVEVINVLKNRGHNIKLDIITDASHREVLVRKRGWHIAFDNIHQNHEGSSGWESASMGIPTLVKLGKEEMYALTEWGDGNPPPFINVRNKDELIHEMEKLIIDRKLLKKKGVETRAWLEKYCSEKRIINRWMEIIDETPIWSNIHPSFDNHILNKPLDLTFTPLAHRTRFHKVIWNIPQSKSVERATFIFALFIHGLVRRSNKYTFMKTPNRIIKSLCWRTLDLTATILKKIGLSLEANTMRNK